MSFIKTWVITVVVSSIVGVVVHVVSPAGSIEKSVKTAVSLFILCAFLSPFASSMKIEDFDIGEIAPVPSDNGKANEIILTKLRLDITDKIEKIFQEHNITDETISMDIRLNNDGEIVIDRVLIVVNQESSASLTELKNDVYSALGLNIEIEVNDEK